MHHPKVEAGLLGERPRGRWPGLHHAVELVELEEPDPIDAGLTTHAPRERAASTAPPLPIIIVRMSVSPRAGTRGRPGHR